MMSVLRILLKMTAMASVMVGIVLVIRIALSRKMHPEVMLVLWTIVLIRLCLPVTFSSPVHFADLIPKKIEVEEVNDQSQARARVDASRMPVIQPPNDTLDARNTQIEETANLPQVNAALFLYEDVINPIRRNPDLVWKIVMGIWAIGAAAVLFISIREAILFKRKLLFCRLIPNGVIHQIVELRKQKEGIKKEIILLECDFIKVPMVFGFFNPFLLLPSQFMQHMDLDNLHSILLHEICHIKRHDILVNYIWLLAKAMHWFNPLVWIAYRYYQDDVELCRDQMVVNRLDQNARLEYSQSLVTSVRLAKMAHRTAPLSTAPLFKNKSKVRERVIRMVNPQKRSISAISISAVLTMLMLISCFTTACQPTPQKKVVVGKGNGNLEDIISGEPAPLESTRNFSVPSKLQYDLSGANAFTVQVDAHVSIPDVDAYPIMSAQRDTITQEQADKIIVTLLKGEPLYKPVWEKNKAQIQASIDRYEHELSVAKTQELKETYQGYLLELMQEYDAAPDAQPMELASLEFAFMEDFPNLDNGYAEDVEVIENGETITKMVWTDKARDRAKADGHKGIYGITAYEHGVRQMALGIQVSGDNSMNHAFFCRFGGGTVDAPPSTIKKITLDQAIVQGKDILQKMGMGDFSLVNAYTEDTIRHELYFKRDIKGLPQSSIVPAQVWNEDYAPAFEGESVFMFIDDAGLLDFQWNSPSKFKATENTNIPLMPFNEVQEIFNKQIVLHNQWSPPDKDIVSYRLVIDQVRLSYMPIRQANNRDSFLYVPVWDFCGEQIARYRDDYPKGQVDHYVLDKNNERVIIGDNLNAVSFLTINAIDGSVIDRNKGY